ncbi:MAG: helicase-exonuclease AddAB subunit AddA [Suipraeoptans sp.]
MSVKWTSEQQEAIDVREKNVLVSAAAGSGKTAVLVERVIQMITDEKNPVSIDELVIVTFTDAAAKEMKERILLAIEEKLSKEPENMHLKEQSVLIHNARISTIHTFCLSVIRDNFHAIGIDPSFRTAEESELILLQNEIISEMFEEYYEEATLEFMEFIDAFGNKRNDDTAKKIILKLYKDAQAYPDFTGYLNKCINAYSPDSIEEFEQSELVEMILKDIKNKVGAQIHNAKTALDISRDYGGPTPYEPIVIELKKGLEAVYNKKTYAEVFETISLIKIGRLPNVKIGENSDYDEGLKKIGGNIIKTIKAEVENIIKIYFFQSTEQMLADIKVSRNHVEMIVKLTEDFKVRFRAKKQSNNIIDYNDMEHYALDILTIQDERGFTPSEIAREYAGQFKEIIIDEYQDSNFLQEVIFKSVSGESFDRYNRFMVGDIKQSIYRFRQARPELFIEKYNAYNKSDGDKNVRIDLHKNFRSREEVLDGVNFMFSHLMIKEVGGVIYDKDAYLNLGADYPKDKDSEVEFSVIEEDDQNSNVEMEAKYIALRIKELIKSGRKYGDIVILMRNIKGIGDQFGRILDEEGIPAEVTSRVGYFTRREVNILLDFLSVIDNGKQDITLAAILKSYFGKMTDEELATIKTKYENIRFCDAFFLYADGDIEEGSDDQLHKKAKHISDIIRYYRAQARIMPIHELLYNIIHETGYLRYVSSLLNGEQKCANIEMLIEKAKSFDATSYKGVFHFIQYIEQLKKYEVDEGEAGLNREDVNSVRIMTIHKSKGLEFPIVFLAQTDKSLKHSGGSVPISLNARLGMGIDYIDTKNQVKGKGLVRNTIENDEQREQIGEELRILYVAMTRAKEKLIMTGMMKNTEVTLESYEHYSVPYHLFSGVKNYQEILLPVMMTNRMNNTIKLNIVDQNEIYIEETLDDLSNTITKDQITNFDEHRIYHKEMTEAIKMQFAENSALSENDNIKMKISVSELKKLAYEEEEESEKAKVVNMYESEAESIVPKFIKGEEKLAGAKRGTAYHRVMELLDFRKTYNSPEEIEESLKQFVKNETITEDILEAVNEEDLYVFFSGISGKEMSNAAKDGKLFKEQPFVLGVPACEIYKNTDSKELILIQGIIDAYYEKDNKLVVLDYKTDKVKSTHELTDKYFAQLEYYKKALEQITGKEVERKVIYSFTLGEEIEI